MAAPSWMVKAAITAVKNPEETKKLFLKIVTGVLCILIIASASALSLVSSFVGEKLDKDFDVTQTKIYQKVEAAYPDFVAGLEKEMAELEEKIIEENTYYVDVEHTKTVTVNGEEKTVTYTTKEARCDITVEKRIDDVSYAYIFAYANHIDDSSKRGKELSISTKEIRKVLKEISYIEQTRIGDVFYLYNAVLAPDEVAGKYFGDESREYGMYVASFELYVDFIGNSSGVITAGTNEYLEDDYIGDILQHGSGMEIPHYFQTDYKNYPYGGGTISSSGCAPTCIAMVMSYLTNETLSPINIVQYTQNKYYVPGAGSSWSIFGACAGNWGSSCQNLGRSRKSVLEALENGKPVIASMGPGTFTKGGHFIVIRGVTSDGYFLINDPNRKNYNKYGTDRFKTSTVFRESKNFWSFG